MKCVNELQHDLGVCSINYLQGKAHVVHQKPFTLHLIHRFDSIGYKNSRAIVKIKIARAKGVVNAHDTTMGTKPHHKRRQQFASQ